MNSDVEVIQKILNFAEMNPDIHYVIQNGSRVNPHIVADEYADYDIIYGCENTTTYLQDQSWIKEFGTLLIFQQNEISKDNLTWPIFLMQFEDGLRIDVQFYPGDPNKMYHSDSLSRVLLDKHSVVKDIFDPSESTYIVRKPSKENYVKEVNEFWWCIINVAKSIARNELCYSRYMYESIVRKSFLSIISWFISSKYQWSINTGKFGKFFENYVDKELWESIKKTYYVDDKEAFWDSIIHACLLIVDIDKELRNSLEIEQAKENEEKILLFIKSIRDNGKVIRPTPASTL